MGSPQALENAARYGAARLLGLLGNTTPASSQAKLYGWKKHVSETTDRPPGSFDNPTKVNSFGPLVNAGFRVQVRAEAIQTFIFALNDFANPFAPTSAEVVAAINARLTHVTAAVEAGGHLSMIDSNSAATTSKLQLMKLNSNDSRYTDALEILGFMESTCDIANFLLSCKLPTQDVREATPPVVQIWDWNASTNVAGAALATAPVYSYAEDTGVLTLTNALAANHTVIATILG